MGKGGEAGVENCANINYLGLNFLPKGVNLGSPKVRRLFKAEWLNWGGGEEVALVVTEKSGDRGRSSDFRCFGGNISIFAVSLPRTQSMWCPSRDLPWSPSFYHQHCPFPPNTFPPLLSSFLLPFIEYIFLLDC